ncbi:hypothetical protein [Priestia aryabhattai]|uniref:hypothetical protein n=1 Tax=Priestia aryabhattai TaxID=412384 RepID=UPI0008DD5522|nr:hypothetical protein [Priestia aryabhattai]OHY73379.1 hypothetical protein BCV52_27085 [Priestia aryabhattai]
MYTRLAEYKDVKGKLSLCVLDEINYKEIDTLLTYQKPAKEYKHLKNLYKMAIKNGNELLSFLEAVYSNDLLIQHMSGEDIHLEGNRLVANYCSFITMFIDQSKKVLSRTGKDKLSEFEKTCNELYDRENFEYRFFVLLRNYTMHYDFPFSRYHEDLKGKSLEFEKSRLLNFTKWKHVKKDFEKMDENIDIRPFITPMNYNLALLLWKIVFLLAEDIAKGHKEAAKFITKYKLSNPGVVKYNNSKELETGNVVWNPIDFKDLQLAFNDVMDHPGITINSNKTT